MAIKLENINKTKVLNQLNTYEYTVPAASIFKVQLRLNEVPVSGITVTLKQNSSTIATLSAPAVLQGSMEIQALMNCALNDVIGVVIASSTASDQGGNSFKATLEIQPGLN